MSHTASADDGKRFVDVPLGTSCAERFMSQERDDIEKTRGRVWEGEGLEGEPWSEGRRMTGSACRSTFRYKLRGTFHEWEKR